MPTRLRLIVTVTQEQNQMVLRTVAVTAKVKSTCHD